MGIFKGTKGKWALHHEHSPKLLVIKGDYSEDVCECLLEADAKLISFAPEMLEFIYGIAELLSEESEIEFFKSKAKELIKKQPMFNYPDPTEEYEEVKEPTLSDLFHECEDMPDEAINYVSKLEKERRDTIEELKVLRDTAKAGGRLDFYVKKLNGLIRKLM